jgi:uncharacterized protein
MNSRLCLIPLFVLAAAQLLPGQVAGIQGVWEGAIRTPTGVALRLRVHVSANPDGALKGTLDSVDQGAFGIPIDSMSFEEGLLKWTISRPMASYEGRLSGDGATVSGTFTQGGMAMELVLKRKDASAAKPPARPQEPKPPFPYQSADLTFPSKAAGVTLAGTLTAPEGAGPHPAVILISGSGPQDRDESIMGHKPFLVLADHLTRAGFVVLRYDDRGVGKSGGNFATSTSVDFSDDAEGAFDFLRGRKEIDPKRIGFVGHSEGGIIAPMVAARREDVAFLVLLAGTAVPGADVMIAQGEAIARTMGAHEEARRANREMQEKLFEAVRLTPDPEELRKRVEEVLAPLPEAQRALQVRQIVSPWMRFFVTYDPAPVLRRVKCPVLALFGEKDLQVLRGQNAAVMEEALKAEGNQRTEVRLVPGVNHLFQPADTGLPQEYATIELTMEPEVLEMVAGWLRRQVGLEVTR